MRTLNQPCILVVKQWESFRKSDFLENLKFFRKSENRQVMSPHNSDQMSQRSQVSWVALCTGCFFLHWASPKKNHVRVYRLGLPWSSPKSLSTWTGPPQKSQNSLSRDTLT